MSEKEKSKDVEVATVLPIALYYVLLKVPLCTVAKARFVIIGQKGNSREGTAKHQTP